MQCLSNVCPYVWFLLVQPYIIVAAFIIGLLNILGILYFLMFNYKKGLISKFLIILSITYLLLSLYYNMPNSTNVTLFGYSLNLTYHLLILVLLSILKMFAWAVDNVRLVGVMFSNSVSLDLRIYMGFITVYLVEHNSSTNSSNIIKRNYSTGQTPNPKGDLSKVTTLVD